MWMGVNAYPISPTVKTAGAAVKGFQTRLARRRGTCNGPTRRTRAPATARKATRHHRLHRAGQAGQPHPDRTASAVLGLPHQQRLFGDADAGQRSTPTRPAPPPTARNATAPPRRALRFPRPTSASSARSSNQSDHAVLRGSHTGTGSSVPTLPVPNGAQILRLAHEPRRHHQQLRGLPRPDHRQRHLRRHHAHRRDAADLADGAECAHPIQHHLRELPPRHATTSAA